jgi:hypothetical protein
VKKAIYLWIEKTKFCLVFYFYYFYKIIMINEIYY